VPLVYDIGKIMRMSGAALHCRTSEMADSQWP
jgi:hypothetical protein